MDSNSKTAQTALSVSEQRSNAALDQMKQSNRFSREALVSVQRAFVVFGYELLANGVTDPTGRRLRRGNFGPLENTGSAPTKELCQHADWEFMESPMASRLRFS